MNIDLFGINLYPWILPFVSMLISMLASTAGISGAFLLLPFQVSVLGINSPSVSGTNHLFNIIAIPGGVWRYIKEGRMLWQLAYIIAAGTLPGVVIGLWLRLTYLKDPTSFKIFAGFVLLYIGYRLLKDILKKSNKKDLNKISNYITNNKNEIPKVIVKKFNLKLLEYSFIEETYSIPTMKLIILTFIVGIAGGAYGIGGGAIISPFLITFYNLPVYTIAGATLFGTFLTSFLSVILYQIISIFNPTVNAQPDWLLGILFGIGGLAGTYIGASLQKFLPAKLIKWLILSFILITAISYISLLLKFVI